MAEEFFPFKKKLPTTISQNKGTSEDMCIKFKSQKMSGVSTEALPQIRDDIL